MRRQQAELDAKESELALLKAEAASFILVETDEAGSTTTSDAPSDAARALADDGAALLDSAMVSGDDPVMAEWRALVQTEKTKCNATVVRAAPDVVDLDAVHARIASLRGDHAATSKALASATDPAEKATLQSKKFIVEAEMKMLNSMARVGAM